MTGIFLVLAWIFSSWTRPFVVMAVIPFGLIGAIWGHAVWDVPLSMFSIVGLIGMVGAATLPATAQEVCPYCKDEVVHGHVWVCAACEASSAFASNTGSSTMSPVTAKAIVALSPFVPS